MKYEHKEKAIRETMKILDEYAEDRDWEKFLLKVKQHFINYPSYHDKYFNGKQ